MSTVPDDIGGSGYTLEDLSAYLDSGREPRVAAIEDNPECRAVLDALGRMSAVSHQLVEEDAIDLEPSWFDGVMAQVAREVKAGRDIPVDDTDDTHVTITEGAVRAMLREAGDRIPGVIVERTRVFGDLDDPEAPLAAELRVSVAYGRRIRDTAELVRRAAADALSRHAERPVASVDVIVDAVLENGERS